MSNSNALATRQQSAALASVEVEERQWRQLMRRAEVLANSGMVQRALQGNVPGTAAVMLACQDLGLPLSVTNVNQFHVIEGSPEPSSQLTLGLAHAAGYETCWGRNDSEVAELSIRRPGSERWETFSYSVADAKAAHFLDEWVESWDRTQSGKNYKRRYVVNCQAPSPCKDARGPVPQWAQKEIDAGNIVHKDNYFNHLADMLRARVAKRAVKAAAPEVRLGLLGQGAMQVHMQPSGATVVIEPEDFDAIADAELVDDGEPTDPVVAVADEEPAASGDVDTSARADQPATTGATPDDNPTLTKAAALIALAQAAQDMGLEAQPARQLASAVMTEYRFDGPVEERALMVALRDIRARCASPAEAPADGSLFGGDR